jgi:hypothetical protein
MHLVGHPQNVFTDNQLMFSAIDQHENGVLSFNQVNEVMSEGGLLNIEQTTSPYSE